MLHVKKKPFISCILPSHNKSLTVNDAIDSLVNQTFVDWQCILFDSGILYDKGFFKNLDHRIQLIRSKETEETRQTKSMGAWSYNEVIRMGLVNSHFVVYLCDDDLFYPGAFQFYYDYWKGHHNVLAMYGEADMSLFNGNMTRTGGYHLGGDEIRGQYAQGGKIDCRMDGGQMCHSVELYAKFPTNEYWSEALVHKRHADGVFMEEIGKLVPVYPIKKKVLHNRKFPFSNFDPTS